jgi:phosphoglycerate dehydrogenase-like enzyme
MLRAATTAKGLPDSAHVHVHGNRAASCRCLNRAETGAQTPEWLQRSELIMGADALNQICESTVTVVGMGGVGSWCAGCLSAAEKSRFRAPC